MSESVRKNREYWDKLCAIPRHGFIHSTDNSRILKVEGIGNWIDRHAAQDVVDAAQDEINALRNALAAALAAPATAVAQESVEVHLVLAEEEYETPTVLRAFSDRSEAETFAQALRDYQQTRPEWPVGDADLEEIEESEEKTRAWVSAHPGGEDAAWRRFFSVIAVPFSAAPHCAAQDGDAQIDAMRRSGLSIDGDNAYKRDLIDCIVGALMLGKQGTNPPPAGHWLEQFWQMARAEGEIQEQMDAEQPDTVRVPAALLEDLHSAIAERDTLRAEVERLQRLQCAAAAQEPVAWMRCDEYPAVTVSGAVLVDWQRQGVAVRPLYAAAPAAEQPGAVSVPRDLLERIAPQLYWSSDEYQELRAILAGGAE